MSNYIEYYGENIHDYVSETESHYDGDSNDNSNITISVTSGKPSIVHYFSIPEDIMLDEEYALLDGSESNEEYTDSKGHSFDDIVGNYIYHKYYDYLHEPFEDDSIYSIDVKVLNELYPPEAESVARIYMLCKNKIDGMKDTKTGRLKWSYKPKKNVIVSDELVRLFTIDFERDDVEGSDVEGSDEDIGNTKDTEEKKDTGHIEEKKYIQVNVTSVTDVTPNVTSVTDVTPNVTSVTDVTPNVTSVTDVTPNVTSVTDVTPNVTSVTDVTPTSN